MCCFYISFEEKQHYTARPAKALKQNQRDNSYFCVCSGYWRQLCYTITKILLSTKVVSLVTKVYFILPNLVLTIKKSTRPTMWYV